jgi:hypothetical protein
MSELFESFIAFFNKKLKKEIVDFTLRLLTTNNSSNKISNRLYALLNISAIKRGAGVTFDWTFFDNSKLIMFDDWKVSFLRKKIVSFQPNT